MNITYHGREIQHPLRWPVAVLIVVFAVLLSILLIVLLPVTIPLSWLLKKSGRFGIFRLDGNSWAYKLDAKAFRRRSL